MTAVTPPRCPHVRGESTFVMETQNLGEGSREQWRRSMDRISFVLSKRHGALRRKTEFAHTRDLKSMGLHLEETEGQFLHVVSSMRESGGPVDRKHLGTLENSGGRLIPRFSAQATLVIKPIKSILR